MHFGKSIEIAREAKGWRQEDLADKIGVTQQAVAKWEAQEAPPWRSAYLDKLVSELSLEMPVFTVSAKKGSSIPPEFLARAFDNVTSKKGQPKFMPIPKMSTPQGIPPDKLLSDLRDALPEARQPFVNTITAVDKTPYRFTYCSNRVVLTVVPGSQNGAPPHAMRIAGWRTAVVLRSNGDNMLSKRHYAVVSLKLPNGGAETAKITNEIRAELHKMDIFCREMHDIASLVAYINELEGKETDMEKFARESEDVFQPTFSDDFSPNTNTWDDLL